MILEIIRKSPVSGLTNVLRVVVTPAQLAAYKGGALIQEAFPHLDADQREFIISGCTAEDWAKMYPA